MRVVVLPDEEALLGEAGDEDEEFAERDVVVVDVSTLLGGVEIVTALLAVVLVTVLVLVLLEPAVGPKGMHVAPMGNWGF